MVVSFSVFLSVLGLSFFSQRVDAQKMKLKVPVLAVTKSGQNLLVHTVNGQTNGSALPEWDSFKALLELVERNQAGPRMDFELNDLTLPFAKLRPQSLGIGLSYPDHQDEVKLENTVFFEKNAEPTTLLEPVPWRETLDYELEVSLLLHRSEPDLFGYLLHNDYTDRGIQVREFNEKDPGPGFSLAKSFPGSNAHGVFMKVGDDSLWETLRAELFLNGVQRQKVESKFNVLKPRDIHTIVFANDSLHQGAEWVLVGTGTPAGTIFRAPSLAEKLWLYIQSGFSKEKAQKKWLSRFDFLTVKDSLKMESEYLGSFENVIIQN